MVYYFTDCLLPSLSRGCHIENVTIGWCVILGHQLSSGGFTVLSSDIDWLRGQNMLFLSSPAPESCFYGPVDKIRAPVWGWLQQNATHPSSLCPFDVCVHNTSISVFGSVYAFVVAVVHTYHRVQKYQFLVKPQSFHWFTWLLVLCFSLGYWSKQLCF